MAASVERLTELAHKYERINEIAWVSAPVDRRTHTYGGSGTGNPYHWCISRHKPDPVKELYMYWRRPTFEEFLERQECYERDPKGFIEKNREFHSGYVYSKGLNRIPPRGR